MQSLRGRNAMRRNTLKNKTAIVTVLIFMAACLGAVTLHAQDKAGKIIYANAASIVATPNGSSWATGYRDLQSAVNAAFANGGGEVWVAAGTYTDTTSYVLTMKGSVALYGGFAGNETARDQRNLTKNTTIIDGEDVRRCVIGASGAVLDGFTITRGNSSSGGGMYNPSASPTVANCTFAGNNATNYGGGIYNNGAVNSRNARPTIKNCNFFHNKAFLGGGMCNRWAVPTIESSSFSQNTSGQHGAGIYNSNSITTVTNCCFVHNSSLYDGGGICNDGQSSITVLNSSLVQNTAGRRGGGLYNEIVTQSHSCPN